MWTGVELCNTNIMLLLVKTISLASICFLFIKTKRRLNELTANEVITKFPE